MKKNILRSYSYISAQTHKLDYSYFCSMLKSKLIENILASISVGSLATFAKPQFRADRKREHKILQQFQTSVR